MHNYAYVEPLIAIRSDADCRDEQYMAAKNYLTRKTEVWYFEMVSIRYYANLPWVSGTND